MTKYHPKTMPFAAFIKNVAPAAVEIDADELNEELCQRFHAVGIKVQAKVLGEKWDNPRVWKQVIDAGADWLQTDDPAGILFYNARRTLGTFPVKIAGIAAQIVMLLKTRCPRYAQPLESVSISPRSTSARHGMESTSSCMTARSTGPRRRKGTSATLTFEEATKLSAGIWFGKPFRETRAILRRLIDVARRQDGDLPRR